MIGCKQTAFLTKPTQMRHLNANKKVSFSQNKESSFLLIRAILVPSVVGVRAIAESLSLNRMLMISELNFRALVIFLKM